MRVSQRSCPSHACVTEELPVTRVCHGGVVHRAEDPATSCSSSEDKPEVCRDRVLTGKHLPHTKLPLPHLAHPPPAFPPVESGQGRRRTETLKTKFLKG